jgi:hypothetical protein
MRPNIAILTPDPADEGFRSRWREVFDRQAAPLEAAGIAVTERSWVDEDLGGFDLVMPLLVWGYHHAPGQWRAAVDRWEAAGLNIANPPSVLRWNADKRYLGRLATRGAPVVPTRFVDALVEDDLHAAAAAFDTDRLIAKPQASASAYQTIRWSPGDPIDGGPSGPAMVQPFLPAVQQEGEISLFYFDGRYSHAILKRPGDGDFRVQPEHGAVLTPHAPAADERAAAEAILAAVEEPLLYARVDLLRLPDGTPALMELELVEPDLSIELDPGGGRAFVEAVARHLPSLHAGRGLRGGCV